MDTRSPENNVDEKPCARCGKSFYRPKRLSETQWLSRRFCGKSCSAKKLNVSDNLVCEMYKGGMTARDVGINTGISGTHVTRILKRNGVKIRSIGDSIAIGQLKPDVRKKMSDLRTGKPCPVKTKKALMARVGPANHNWGNGITVNSQGYLCYTASKENGDRASRSVHRVRVEEYIGMKLPANLHVHHKDRNKLNNALDNLEVMTASQHMKHHMECGDLDWRNKC